MDAFEINFSCPHGMPERKMGMAMGQVRDGYWWGRGVCAHLTQCSEPLHTACLMPADPTHPAPMKLPNKQDCEILHEVCGWINAKATIPVWAKMTPNITGEGSL